MSFRADANAARTPATDAGGPTGSAQTRGAAFDVLMIKLVAEAVN